MKLFQRFLPLILTILNVCYCEYDIGDDYSCPNSVAVPWSPDWMTGNDLVCPCVVKDAGPNEEQRENFCKCRASPYWTGQEKALDIEYITVMGKTLIIPDSTLNTSDVYTLQHSSDEMTELPSNLCNWDTLSSVFQTYSDIFTEFEAFWKHIVDIDLSWSSIKTMRDINCLERLYSLDLSRNRLTHIPNTIFNNLTQLRHVDFSFNQIVTIDPALTSADNLQLMVADFSFNPMELLDVSNMFSKYPFCSLDYENNQITELVNELNVEIDFAYGPGFVDLKYNDIQKFPDFKQLLYLEDLAEIGKLISFGFDLRGIPLVCDCNLQPFRALSDDVFKSLWRDYFNVTCTAPDRHVGKFAFHIPMEDLICPIEANINMTIGCTYSDVPDNNTMYVNCSGAGLNKLPDTMPHSNFSEYISLDISNNSITHIDNVTYLSKLSVLDISNNMLFVIENETGFLLENTSYIDISNNPTLREIPQIFQYRNSCSINSENDVIVCDCDTRWIIGWLTNRQCGNETLFDCNVEGHGTMLATSFWDTMLDCESENTIILMLAILLSGLIALIIVIATLVFHFKYELLILYLRSRRTKACSVSPERKYDVYVAHDMDDEKCRKWVTLTLVPELQKNGYKLYIPVRDLDFGEVKLDVAIKIMNESRAFLFVLSEGYVKLKGADKDDDDDDKDRVDMEWKYAWNMMRKDRTKKIVLVNYDFISSFDVLHPQIRAYLRVGYTVTFDNWDRDMIPRIIKQLGINNRQQKRRVIQVKTSTLTSHNFTDQETDVDKIEIKEHEDTRLEDSKFHSVTLSRREKRERRRNDMFGYYMYMDQSKNKRF